MPNPLIRIHNSETNEVIDRPMTDAEFSQYETDKKTLEAEKALAETKKQEVLAKLGISAEEAASLLA